MTMDACFKAKSMSYLRKNIFAKSSFQKKLQWYLKKYCSASVTPDVNHLCRVICPFIRGCWLEMMNSTDKSVQGMMNGNHHELPGITLHHNLLPIQKVPLFACTICTYVLWCSGISRKSAALIVRYSQKKKWISIVFYCSENPSIAHNLGTTGPIQVGFSAKCTSPNDDIN